MNLMMKNAFADQSHQDIRSAIFALAERIGGGWEAAQAWFHEDAIASLDDMTAFELVIAHRGHQVLAFLLAVLAKEYPARSTAAIQR